MTVTCPTATVRPDGTPHTVVGCGSANVQRDDAEPHLFDCLDCGIWFDPSAEPATATLGGAPAAQRLASVSARTVAYLGTLGPVLPDGSRPFTLTTAHHAFGTTSRTTGTTGRRP